MHRVARCWGITLGTWCGEEGDGHAEASVFPKKVLRTEMCRRPRDHLRGGAQEATGGGERGEARTRRC